MSTTTVSADKFQSALTGMLTNSMGKVIKGTTKAVREGAKVSRDMWEQNAHEMLNGTGRYATSITYRMHRSAQGPSAEIGSATMPGLAHLLEKGHALVGGGHSRAFVHIEPAAQTGFDTTLEYLEEIEL